MVRRTPLAREQRRVSDSCSSGARIVALIVSLSWGLLQTMVGAILTLALWPRCTRARFRTAIVTVWPLASGLSLGMFIFVPRGCQRTLVLHEYGHTLQSLMLGPLYLPLIVLPSLMWAGIPAFGRLRRRRSYSYYRFYTERWANLLAHRLTGNHPEGWY